VALFVSYSIILTKALFPLKETSTFWPDETQRKHIAEAIHATYAFLIVVVLWMTLCLL